MQNIIYGINGQDSLFEFIGAKIFEKNPNATLKEVYENALYFIFRLLFIAYFEDKFGDILQSHEYFTDEISLSNLIGNLEDKEESFRGFVKLSRIFAMYDKGEPNYNMPVFNGGLFDSTKAPLLSTQKLFSDKSLKEILGKFFYFDDGQVLFRRDYKSLSVAHLGTIYEGLLGYFFVIADEDLWYVKYSAKGKKGEVQKEIESYVDSYDFAELQKKEKLNKAKIIGAPKHYAKGQIYLKNTSNSRKSSASFYTPQSITSFLVAQSLKDENGKHKLDNDNILHFKILDNACGSGHFLIEALNQITQIVLKDFDSFSNLKQIYEAEKQEIQANTTHYIKGYEVDESDILKRLLLKRVIFGVDINPFSVELTKLSLWIDSFIFGTPLSFIEHHIKCGNALVGSTIAEFRAHYDTIKNKGSLFMNEFLKDFGALSEVFDKLDCLKDTSEAQITQSKRIYTDEILPTLDKLNLYLNFFTAFRFATPSECKKFASLIELENLLSEQKGDYKDAADFTREKAKDFSFFNYEIEFPEIVLNGELQGFQAIVGNPPWDKTKFSDNDFFPQYKSDYRTLGNKQKAEFEANMLVKPTIREDYEAQKQSIERINAYYKTRFGLSRGKGDGNLFRFFVERNLGLLAHDATLNYVLPSALMLEEGSYTLRKEILQERTLTHFYAFENREGIFNSVHRSYKFALMQVKNAKPPQNHRIKTMFYKTKIDEIYERDNVIELSLADIEGLSPAHLALQEVRDKRDLEILGKCYGRFAPLESSWLDFRNELHMTKDENLFIDEADIDDLYISHFEVAKQPKNLNDSADSVDSSLHAMRYAQNDKNLAKHYLPLYEGKRIHQYNAEFENPTKKSSDKRYFLEITSFDERLKSKEISRLKDDLGIKGEEYKALLKSLFAKHCEDSKAHKTAHCHSEGAKEAKNPNSANSTHPQTPSATISSSREEDFDSLDAFESSLISYDREYIRLGSRAIASDTNERTLIFSLLPRNIGVGNSAWSSITKSYVLDSGRICTKPISHIRLCFALGILNALVVDFIARMMIQMNVNKTYLERLPLPQPSDDEILANECYVFIARSALILQLYNDKAGYFDELKCEFGIKNDEIPSTNKLYLTLKARLDIAVAKLYGLDFEDFCYLLESFQVLKTNQPEYIALLKGEWK
ncbi:Eco57I restriction-modification methylase domain-containing protein [Helicobacter macacae]|uniref:site-specific DNA-methyltransferase (adenine-specific) n=1 Tax=Helicobacter macacae MIT 99-5501 TaxID=1357400 RepID=V8CBL8_9HELI|nr:N-6 DNA methylase [Helicobacter macacae]ETD24764.1 hypothetical protein HMPREF2086_00098 [Helicobacter macacae MIT 99-5501]